MIMVKSSVQTALVLLLASSLGWAQGPGNSGQPPAHQGASAGSPDAALTELLTQLQALAQQSDRDLAGLRIEKWKADATNKQQAQENAAAIHRNLANAVPELLQKIQSEPGSVAANFRLYRDLDVLYDAFSALVESAGAFGPAEQYSTLAGDIARLDQLRHQLAERLDQMAGANDAELLRLRARLAASPAKAVPAASKVVVDDNHPAARKKPKSPPPHPRRLSLRDDPRRFAAGYAATYAAPAAGALMRQVSRCVATMAVSLRELPHSSQRRA